MQDAVEWCFSRGLFSEDTTNERGGDLIQETETEF